MQTIVYQCDTAMPAQKLPNCCNSEEVKNKAFELYILTKKCAG